MSAPDLASIPLPVGPSSTVTMKKSGQDMRQVKDHKDVLSKKPAASSEGASKLHTCPGSAFTAAAGLDGKESSQQIVDQLFKDFIAQKITSTSRISKDAGNDETVSRVRNSADEISKLLDMEIKSIKSSTENRDKLIDRKDQRLNSLSKHSKFIPVSGSVKEDKLIDRKDQRLNSLSKHSKFIPVSGSVKEDMKSDDVLTLNSDTPSIGSSQNPRSISASENKTDAIICQSTADDNRQIVTTATETVSTITHSIMTAPASTTQPKDSSQPVTGGNASHVQRNVMLPVSLAKKMMQPKVLGVKLSTQSLSLITSKDRIDRDGRVWEEGEVCSSGSEASDKNKGSDSEADGFPSDSGSVHSNSEDWKSQISKHKKKHKHKHKKKKKKSSKEKDVDRDKRRSKDTDDKDKEKRKTHSKGDKGNDKDARSSKDRDDKKTDKLEKDQAKEGSEKHSRDKHKSLDQDHESKRREKDSDKKRERSHSRSRSPKRRKKSKSRTRSRSKSPKRHRSHSRSGSPPQSHGSGRYDEWDARRYSDDPSRLRSRSRSRSKDRSSERHRRSRDRSKSHERDRSNESKDRDLRVKIDKAKLRKIAIANALQNMKAGQGPQLDLTLVKSGGKSVEELTEFCKRISEKSQVDNDETDDSSDGETAKKSDDEEMLIHHPFKVKETSSVGIIMNIRNAKQLPVLTPSEKQAQQATLRLTFPVSSGSHHRASESEWVPVVKAGPIAPVPPSAPAPQVTNVAEPQVNQNIGDSIFPDVSEAQKIDIGSIISERLQAVRKLQENPYDMQALSKMHQVQQQASKWAASRHLPGQFVGSTGAHVLSQEQLIGDRRHQAWAKKTQLSQAAPVNGGIGMFLLQKMGWKQGEGLGKNNEGSKEPLMLDIKVDRRGLTTAAENPRHRAQAPAAAPRAKDLSNKHPVSALMELCNRRRWGPPLFTVVSESGPDHKKNFLFKVRVNNVEYQPAAPSSNKKTAKALCAAICLQEMGLLPRDAPLNI